MLLSVGNPNEPTGIVIHINRLRAGWDVTNLYTIVPSAPPVLAPWSRSAVHSGMIFGGFGKCLYDVKKFDSDPERRFAVLLEDEDEVPKWFKPAKGRFTDIYYHKDNHYHKDSHYEPDFVVETKTAKYLCVPKRASEMQDAEVLEKARATAEGCEWASEHALENDGKFWSYFLIPHDAITANKTLRGLAASYHWGKRPV
jgi:type III restriction enzyme